MAVGETGDHRRAWVVVLPECLALAGVLAVLWFGAWTILQSHRNDDLAAARRDASALTRVLEADLNRLFSNADSILLSMRSSYLANPNGFDVADWVRNQSRLDGSTLFLGLIGPDGVVHSSTVSPAPAWVGDRASFRALRDADHDLLFIGAPVLGKATNRWSIQLARRVTRPDGTFAGIVMLAIDAERLANFIEKLDLRHGFFALANLDGVIETYAPSFAHLYGASIAQSGLPEQILQDEHGVLHAESDRDGGVTLGYRRLHEFPLVVATGLSDIDTLERYEQVRDGVLQKCGWASILILALGMIWLRQRRHAFAIKADLEATLQSMKEGLVVVASDGHVPIANDRALELLGIVDDRGHRFRRRSTEAQRTIEARLRGALDETLRPGRTCAKVQVHGRMIECRTEPRAGNGMLHILSDVTAQHRAGERIRYMALHDSATQLGNRLCLNEWLDSLLQGPHPSPFGLLTLRLEGYRRICETLGKPLGDQLLRAAVDRLRLSLGDQARLFRLENCDLAVLTQAEAGLGPALKLAQSLRQTIARPFLILGQQFRLFGSVGICRFPQDGATTEALIQNAEIALGAASADRDAGVQEFRPELAAAVRDRLLFEEDFRSAADSDQFFLEYQPQFCVSSLEITGFEALVRWAHPVRGCIGPGEFIPIAEETGLIIPLGRKLLLDACRTASEWPQHVRIAVNLSPVQFRGPELIPTVAEILAQTGLAPSRLELEVTEGVLLSDQNGALETLHALRRLGVRLALDDFGTGYASLGYLCKFPFERIKVDRSFVQAQVVEHRSRQVLQSIFDLCRKLDLDVLAEGVETRTQLALLQQQHCQDIQGFLVGRPMNAAQAKARLADPAALLPA